MKKDWHELVSQPKYDTILDEDVWVPMRDGVRLAVDIYRPNASGKFPALLSFWSFGKDTQKLPTNHDYRPSDFIRGTGGHECGEQSYFVPRGYVQVIPDIRGVGISEGEYRSDFASDGCDLIEWIAEQSWCNGNVSMAGMSGFARAQYNISPKQPPHLKAIFPFDSTTDAYRHRSYQGGIFNYYFNLLVAGERMMRRSSRPASFKEFDESELKQKIKDLQANPDIRTVTWLYHLTIQPERNPALLDAMLHPYDGPFYQLQSEYTRFKNIKIPAYIGSRWDAWAGKLPASFDAYTGIATPKEDKKLLVVPSGMDRPFHEVQDVCLRWYDHWLKGNDTGIMDEPPILFFILGIHKWRYEKEWPLAATDWVKFYLRGNGRLSPTPPGIDEEPQTFTSEPWANPNDPVPKAIYETEPLGENVEVTGPIALYWNASIESKSVRARTWKASEFEILEPLTNDTDWYLQLKDIDVDGAERHVAAGWLKASHYEVDESKSKPYAPYHPHTRSLPIEPNEVILYSSDMRMTSNVFLSGHKIRIEIAGQDQLRFLAYHLPHTAEVKHVIYSFSNQPSYLLLPIIPKGYEGAGEPDYPPIGPFRMPKYIRKF